LRGGDVLTEVERRLVVIVEVWWRQQQDQPRVVETDGLIVELGAGREFLDVDVVRQLRDEHPE
jgi:hypothetical protein